jgi:hypothetical protein
LGRNPYETGKKSASKMGSNTSFSAAWTTRSAMLGTCASYCDPFHALCGLGFDGCGELVGVDDPL